ncbi:sulfite oxidase [Geodermatophilus sp. YIM 151500]|uniref:sulfite oxidase n=1 Tax=Geodermatophilus sp. YIM 151500 TaxID=2984531 RepID=UPI0021E500E3|nr:sulfite oxidase [Geodermatophilus sp. YIM 151500]MCV2489877.1 sulfite oxidase [Geodermatophilus sp. YIM 151500]
MGLFIVRHEHRADHCPATDPAMGALLLNHLSRVNTRRHGIDIHGEAVAQGAHALYMIVSADAEDRVRHFLEPFARAGTVEVLPASTCAGVVASGGCAALPVTDPGTPAADPEEVCQDAMEAGLVVHRAHPLNGETSIPALLGGVVMPNAHFYVRNHFQIPLLDPSAWRLEVVGRVERPLRLTLGELRAYRSQSTVVTMECAGNGRFLLDPAVPGEQWRHGAVSTAEWTGVPLAEVLDRVGVGTGAREVVFRGADHGTVDGRADPIRFERSLALDVVREAGVLLAYAMNGEPIPRRHGYPVRLVVPDWYGVASVKWLTEIELTDRPFEGYFQTEKYRYEWNGADRPRSEPVTLQRVRALITDPAPDDEVDPGELTVRGVAWSGAAAIDRVEVSIDARPWQEARLVGERRRHSWQWWELRTRLEATGAVSLRARATDLAGRSQPERPEWNRLGYGNNAIQEVLVTAR